MISIDLILRGFAQYPTYGIIAFASLIMNYFVVGFIIARQVTPYVEREVHSILEQNVVISMAMLLWPILVGLIIAMIVSVNIIALIGMATGKDADIEIRGLFKEK